MVNIIMIMSMNVVELMIIMIMMIIINVDECGWVDDDSMYDISTYRIEEVPKRLVT